MHRSLPALSRRQFLAGAAGSAVAALLAACGGSSTAMDTPKPAAPTTGPESATLGSGTINGMKWDEILAKAKGGTANWFLYGGSQTTNDYLDKYVAPKMKELYGVTLQRTPVTDTVDAVNK